MRAFHTTILAGGDGCCHMPPAMDTILSQGTGIGATLAATTIASGDSFTIKNANLSSKVWMLTFWTHNVVAGIVRIRSPKLHDNVDAIRSRVPVTTLDPLLPLGTKQQFYPQDTEIVELAGSSAGTNIESVVQLMYYEDLPGQATRFIDPGQLASRQKQIIGQRIAITLGTTTGYNGSRAINADNDQFHANTDYAILGMTSDIAEPAICVRGPDTGNLRVSCPGSLLNWQLTARWFVKLSKEYGMALIPVFNSANKAGTNVDMANLLAGGTANVTIWLAELTP